MSIYNEFSDDGKTSPQIFFRRSHLNLQLWLFPMIQSFVKYAECSQLHIFLLKYIFLLVAQFLKTIIHICAKNRFLLIKISQNFKLNSKFFTYIFRSNY